MSVMKIAFFVTTIAITPMEVMFVTVSQDISLMDLTVQVRHVTSVPLCYYFVVSLSL